MYRLRTLGGLTLERGGSPLDPVGAQRKALALLAALAVHESLARERIQALLWPESGPDRARGSLKQLAHLLRRQLAAPELFLGTAELRLNPDCVTSDVRDFLTALRADRAADAVAIYGGPFLDGVHIEDGSEFNQWLDGWRSELEHQFRGALEAVATDASARGDLVEAVACWRRAQAADPLNGRIALRLMEALEAAGERAGALQHARVHELLVREQLGLAADPAVVELATRLRQASRSAEPAPTSPTAAASVVAAEEALAQHAAPRDRETEDRATTRPPLQPRVPRVARLAHAVFLSTVAILLAVVAGIGLTTARDHTTRLGAAVADTASIALRARPPSSLAVIPFIDLSESGDQEYLADGITEEILLSLSKVPDLRVPARSSSFFFKRSDLPGPEIARRLGVDVLLAGTVRRADNRLRVTAQLTDGAEDRVLWSAAFDETGADAFELPTLVAARVADALRLQLASTADGRADRRTRVPDSRAHDQYLRGLFHWNRRSTPDLQLALRFFEEAVRLDPDYGRAWAGLALVYAVLPIGFVPGMPPDEARARLEAAASRALALDSTLAEVHAALGFSLHFAWQWDAAEAAYRRALALDPGYATAHQWYGEHLAKLGRWEEGAASMRRAIALDPLSLVAKNDLGLVLMLGKQLPDAVAQWEEIVRLDPSFAIPHYFLHRVHLQIGQYDASAASGRRWAELAGAASVDEILTLTQAVADSNLRDAARRVLSDWQRAPHPRWHDIAFYLVMLGEYEEAVRILERGVAARHPMMAQIIAGPWVDPLRDHPRMRRVLREMVPTP